MTTGTLRDYVACSPRDPAPVAVALLGVWTPVDGGLVYVCRTCLGRLMGRGVSIPVESHVWYDAAEPTGACVGCELAEAEDLTV
jgi:hypothetical protein